jgi:hypothetical protein
VAPVVLAVLVYRIQFVVAHSSTVVVAVEAEHHQETQVRLTVLVVRVEVALADPVAVVLASCQQQARQTPGLVAEAAVGASPTLNCNELVLPVQTE